MKNYTVNLEVILSGGVDVEAESQAEAIEIAKKQIQVISDMRNFWIVSKCVEDVEEIADD